MQALCARILCPSQQTVALVEKPNIPGAMSMGVFALPPFVLLSCKPLVVLLDEMMAVCDGFGYPVMIKGSVNGASLCSSWASVCACVTGFVTKEYARKSHGNLKPETVFVQVSSCPCGLSSPSRCCSAVLCLLCLFCALFQLLRSLRTLPCTSCSAAFVANANLWALFPLVPFLVDLPLSQKVLRGTEKTIAFAAYHGELTGAVLMTKTNVTCEGKVWSATVTPVSAAILEKLRAFVLESNWTGGGELEFIETLTGQWYIIDFNPRFPAWFYGGCHSPPSDSTGAGAGQNPNLPGDLLAHVLLSRQGGTWCADKYLAFQPIAFCRTVMEQPVCHLDLGRTAYMLGHGGWSMKSARGDMDEKTTEPATITDAAGAGAVVDDASAGAVGTDVDDVADLIAVASPQWWIDLQTAADHALQQPLQTPSYLLSCASIQHALSTHSNQLASDVVHVQMCLSVKTQPHTSVLSLALEAGYFAECISLAEVRAALEVGYTTKQIILTGPGKFWEGYLRENDDSQYVKLSSQPGGLHLAAIFADSLADLKRILQRINDPKDCLRADVVGIRFLPLGTVVASRFGVDGSNPRLLRELTDLFVDLPADVKLGAHLHFASSAPGTGQGKWLGMARAALSLALNFASLCHRPLDVMDFGGGWHPHAIEGTMPCDMQELMQWCMLESTRQQIAVGKPANKLTVMFEMGKSISERAGGVLSRVLEIREVGIEKPKHADEPLTVKTRALIVDTTIAEISVPHLHPIFWQSPTGWQLLSKVGYDELWGRTCMEFDVLVGATNGWGGGSGSCGLASAGLSFPKELQVGDMLLIGGCGAYDMTMQYDFGDGIGRSRCVVCPLP